MKTLLVKRSKYYGEDVSLHTGRKPSGKLRDAIEGMQYFCYSGWLRHTGIKLEPGQVKEFEIGGKK